MEILGYFGALLIGITLGLIGSGGSILAVPIFVYIMGINPVLATAYSLFVVGTTSTIGAVRKYMQKGLNLKTGLVFSFPAFVVVYLTRKYLVPAIPEDLLTIQEFVLTKDTAIMVFFAILMFFASVSMIKTKKIKREVFDKVHFNYPLIVLEGSIVGVLTGLFGAGGGFLIIPALVIFAKLPMKKAVGTSLMIIAMKSLFGFIGDVQNLEINWTFLLSFTSISIVGILIGIYFSKNVSNTILKKIFGWFVLLMSLFILIKELVF